jgi:ankyrin repeat domain-containing protein 50
MSDVTSTSQAGLEALDTIEEFAGRHGSAVDEPIRDWRIASSANDRTNAENGRRGSHLNQSAQSDNDRRVRALESEMRARCPEVTKDPVLERPSVMPRYTSNVERADAHDLLVRRRCSRPNYKDPNSGLGRLKTRKSKMKASDTHRWQFNDVEICQALKEAVECQPVGVVEALLEMGTNITSPHTEQKGKILRRKVVEVEPENLLEVAVSRGNTDVLQVLASHGALSSHMAQALHSAVKQNLPDLVQILLEYGADPNAFRGGIILSAIELQKSSLVRLLFRAPVRINSDLLTDALEAAVTRNSLEIVSLLVLHEADINHKRGIALRKAVQDQRIEIVLSLMKGRPTATTVSAVFDDAFSANSQRSVEEQQLLVKILLDAGATGEPLDEVLLRVVREGHQSIAKLLIRHHASPHYRGGEVLSISLVSEDLQMLRMLMSGPIDKSLVNELFNRLPRTYHKQETYDLISLLVSKGAEGRPLDAALVTAVQQKSSQVLELLLDNQACAD